MKTITTEQLAELTWNLESVSVGDHFFDAHQVAAGCDAEGEPEIELRFQSYVYGTCLLRCVEQPSFTYSIEWQANGGEDTLADAYGFGVELNPEGENDLDTGDIEILGEDGDIITASEADSEVGICITEGVAWEHEVKKHLPEMPEAEAIDNDTDEDTDMDTIALSRDTGPDVRFQGEEVASASSRGMDSTRWTELTLYRTAGGKLVCQEIGRSLWQGERDRRSLHVADTEAALIESLGYGWLAKALYEDAGIDHAEEIE